MKLFENNSKLLNEHEICYSYALIYFRVELAVKMSEFVEGPTDTDSIEHGKEIPVNVSSWHILIICMYFFSLPNCTLAVLA